MSSVLRGFHSCNGLHFKSGLLTCFLSTLFLAQFCELAFIWMSLASRWLVLHEFRSARLDPVAVPILGFDRYRALGDLLLSLLLEAQLLINDWSFDFLTIGGFVSSDLYTRWFLLVISELFSTLGDAAN